jgi:rfaE bifunctional protein kinase chain/domain
MISRERLQHVLDQTARHRVALLGDLFLDRYLEIPAGSGESSVETGLEAHQVARVRNSPGALGTVMNNLAALRIGLLLPVSVLGTDGHAFELMREVERLPADTSYIVRDAARLTPTYTKPMQQQADGSWRELNRLDFRTRAPLSPETEDLVLRALAQALAAADALVVADQICEENWGVVTARVRDALPQLVRAARTRVVVVDSRAHVGRFRCGVLKPNAAECLRALEQAPPTAPPSDWLAQMGQAVCHLARRTGCPVLCTLSEHGMLVAEPAGQGAQHVPSPQVPPPIDPVGAGDSATAGIVCSLLAGTTLIEAAAVGNLAASLTVQQVGTTGTATPEQVLGRWEEAYGSAERTSSASGGTTTAG